MRLKVSYHDRKNAKTLSDGFVVPRSRPGEEIDSDTSPMIDFFIYGYPRSGTSLVRAIINSTNEAHIPPECSFVSFFRDRYSHWAPSNFRQLTTHFVSDLMRARKFETWNVTHSDVVEAISKSQPSNYADLCGAVYRLHAKQKSPTCLIGDKNNVHIFERATLQQMFPESIAIYVIRDPRAVFASIQNAAELHRHKRYAPTAEVDTRTFCAKWSEAYEKVLRDPKSNELLVRYEDLISEPQNTIVTMFRVLGLNSSLVNSTNVRTLHISNFDEPAATMPWKEYLATEISDQRLFEWRNRLSTYESEEISDCLAPTMRSMNYAG